jgi:hypothetical protein
MLTLWLIFKNSELQTLFLIISNFRFVYRKHKMSQTQNSFHISDYQSVKMLVSQNKNAIYLSVFAVSHFCLNQFDRLTASPKGRMGNCRERDSDFIFHPSGD